MNITELARIIKVTPQELHEYLPKFGYDIGRKAIKINNSVANRIIKEWPVLRRRIEMQKSAALSSEQAIVAPSDENRKIVVPKVITVRDFAALTGQPVKAILAVLMKNGIIASLNEKIDYETAWLIASELGYEVSMAEASADDQTVNQSEKMKEIMAREQKKDLAARPPVIVVMGHVDHGKTKLLDAIRRTDVVAGEAGGITQHIGAYQVERRGKLITFIDTPGHEAFTAMRSRGAKIADIAILVVAADDGVMPQTAEASQIIKAAKIPFVVAINKIDKPEANLDKTRQELSSKLNVVCEDWGGQTVCAPISAKDGTGIIELLDIVLLLAETEAEHITANPDTDAVGTVIESHVDKGAGPVATVLVQNGTLSAGDRLTLNGVEIGKVRGLNDYRGTKLEKAVPSTPVQIIGLKSLPQVGDVVEVGEGEKVRFRKGKTLAGNTFSGQSDMKEGKADTAKKVNLIIKSDVLGSAEAIEEALLKINTEDVKVDIVRKGLGNVTDGDIKQAEAAGAMILGFNVKTPPVIEDLARERSVEIRNYNIIYNLINDIKEIMQSAIEPVIIRHELGRLKVLAIFNSGKNSQIIGARVLDGRVEPGATLRVLRDHELLGEGKIIKLESGKQKVSLCEAGQECGIEFEGRTIVGKDDLLEAYKEEETIKKL